MAKDSPALVIETITPTKAKTYLSLNEGNRRVREADIRAYARDMAAGRWEMTGDPIKFNGSKLLDGQHRLLACIQAGVPFRSAVAYNISASAHGAIDNGVKRTAADELAWLGCGDPATTAALLSLLWRWDYGVLNDPKTKPSKAELVLQYESNPEEITRSANLARRVWATTRIPSSALGAMHIKLSDTWDTETADAWLDHLGSGSDYIENDPALTLRTYSLRVQAVRSVRPRQIEWLAVLIKATNAWLGGQTMRTVRWRSVGPAAERFPDLLSQDEMPS